MEKEKVIQLEHTMQETLKKSRYRHTLGVAYTAACLAMRYQINSEDAYVAGLLHDCAKCFSETEVLKKCKKYKIELNDFEKNNPYIVHGRLGSIIAEKEYEISNQEILSAIACHTTGKPNMTTFEKILFIADYIEPARDQAPRLNELRQMAFQNLDICLTMVLEDTLHYLMQTNLPIDPSSEVTYQYYNHE